jgi:hypothetical protein
VLLFGFYELDKDTKEKEAIVVADGRDAEYLA